MNDEPSLDTTSYLSNRKILYHMIRQQTFSPYPEDNEYQAYPPAMLQKVYRCCYFLNTQDKMLHRNSYLQ